MIFAIVMLIALVLTAVVVSSSPPVPRRTVDMPPGEKVIGYYWIDEDFYIIYRPMAIGEHPEDWEAPNYSVMSIDVPTVYIHETAAISAERPRIATVGH